MTSIPLHPALVHLPLGLAFVIPALAIGFTWALWRNRIQVRTWVVIIVLQSAMFGGALLAMNTGEREGERIESIVPEQAVETHEAYAEQFVWAVGITLAIGTLVLLIRRPIASRALAVVTVAATLVVAGMAIRVGHAGGQLVYVHNAGAAYGSPGDPSAQAIRSTGNAHAGDTLQDDD